MKYLLLITALLSTPALASYSIACFSGNTIIYKNPNVYDYIKQSAGAISVEETRNSPDIYITNAAYVIQENK